ncbi:MAG: hypothetical protein ACF8R7_06595 [Phycisphaerales bacterium JB039]
MSRLNTRAADLPPSRVRRLMRSAGFARPGASRAVEHFESLENRVLLGGDHPSFMLPLSPTSGTEIVLDMNGDGSDTGTIEDTTPDLFDDLFRFVAPADDFVRIWADTVNTAMPSDFDSRVEVYNLAGDLISSGSSQGRLTGGTFDDGWTGFIAQAGETYFVRVLSDQMMGAGATGDYIIRVNTLSQTFDVQTNPTPPPGEPRFGFGETDDEITTVGADEVYKLVIPSAQDFDSLATLYATNALSVFDPRLDVYDAEGRFVRGDSEAGRLNAAFLAVRSGPDSVFYVRIRGDEFDGSIESTGSYGLKADTRAIPIEVDPVTRRAVTTEAVPNGYDSRLFGFQAQGTGLNFITVRGIPIPPLADPAIRLYNDQGQQIGFDRIGAELQIQLVGGEQYWFVVEEFDLGNGGLFAAWIEAHHTFDTQQGIDDHASTPPGFDPAMPTDEDRRIFESATPIIWGPPDLTKVREPAAGGSIFPFQDINPIGDRSYVVTGTATGRIHQGPDTDLFQFVPPVDMLGGYGGDNDDAGDALFIGTAGAVKLKATDGPPDYNPVQENFLGIWDAFAYWEVQAGVSATVRAMTQFDYGGTRPALVIGGEFTSANYDPTPFIAAYWFNEITGLFEFADLGGGTNGFVHALHTFAFEEEDFTSLIVGGEFTNVGNRVARWVVDIPALGPGAGHWEPLGGGASDTVYAITDFDSPDPEEGDAIPRRLVIGGEFGLRWYNLPEMTPAAGGAWENVYTGIGGGPVTVNGPVYALIEFTPPPVMGEEQPPQLILGGDFTTVGGQGRSRIAGLTLDPAMMGTVDNVNLGGGTNNTVYALTLWDRDGEDNDVFLPELIAGGSFTNRGGRVASWDGAAWSPLGLPPFGETPGFDNTVRALVSFTDTEYGQGLFSGDPEEPSPVLYAGGDFTTADGDQALRLARLEFNALAGDWEWLAMGDGATDTVYALENFNDEIPGAWDRKDRTATRMNMVISPVDGGFENTFIRVYDSNLALIYENDTIAPPFPDPSGMIDPSGSPGDLGEIAGIPVWGGEVYYLEISSVGGGGTGRYSVTIRADAYPPDTTGGRARDDVISSYVEPVGEHGLPDAVFAEANPINLADMSSGDGRNFLPLPNAAFNTRSFEFTPSGFQVTQWSELGNIHSIEDVDVYRFRAPADGTIEIRTVTHQIADEFYEEIANLKDGSVDSQTLEKTYNSPLDSKIRVFNNDFVELAVNDDNQAFAGELIQQVMGSFGVADTVRTFRAHDARVVVPIVSGDTYFIVVESGQYASFVTDPSEVDWRRAAGSYELLLNAVPQLDFEDDHPDFTAPAVTTLSSGTVIPLDAGTGVGSITGEIRPKLTDPFDDDQFVVQAVQDGAMTITVSPTIGSGVIPSVTIFDGQGEFVGASTAPGGGVARVQFAAGRGDLFYVVVSASQSTQGEYRVRVDADPFVDDHATHRFDLATELEIRDFLGTAEANGSLEAEGDIDLFKFETPDFDRGRITVESLTTGFNAAVKVFEVSVDPSGNPVLLRIAENADAPTATAAFSLTAPDRTSLATGATYNTYYVMVSGADPTADAGDYRITLQVTPTDDHPDENEFAFATPVTSDTITGVGADSGILEIDEDSDLFGFRASAGGQATVTVTATDDLRPTLLILDQSFNPVEHLLLGTTTPIEGPDALGSSATYVFRVVRGQQYYMLVNGVLGGMATTGTGPYTLDIVAPIVDDHPNEGEFSIASEIVLSQITGDGGVSALISPTLDTDLFFFRTLAKSTPAEPGPHNILLDARAGGFDPILRIFNAGRAEIANIVDNGPGDTDPRVGVVGFTVQSVARNELFYILADADDGATTTTGSYQLTIDGPEPGLPDPNPDDDHANEGQFFAATVIDLDPRTGSGFDTGIIEISGDTDLFRFDSLTGGAAFVQVVTPTGTLLDTRLTVFERRGSEYVVIDADTVGIPGANSYSEFQTLAPGAEYYLLVEDVSDGRGSYTVEIATEPETFFLYFPEGFAGDDIREYISFANPSATDSVTYDVILYYENPDLAPARLVSGGTLAPGARGGLTVSDAGRVFNPMVQLNEPYSIVIESDGVLGATFAHYDFGAAIGESFTGRTSDIWTFARVERNPGGVEDFLVYYNPNAHDVTVTLTAYSGEGAPITIEQTVGANRRGGWSVDDLAQLPLGVFSVRLTSAPASTIEPGDSHIGIVAALSHFDIVGGSAFAVLGDALGGSTLSVIPRVERGDGVETQITIFNPGSTTTAVTIIGSYTQAAFEDVQQNVTVAARSFVTLTGADLGLIRNQPLGLRFDSVRPITVTAVQTEKGDAAAIQAVAEGATTWFFGDAFINNTLAGDQYFETISFYNPASASLAVDIKLYFNDGSILTDTITVGPDGFAEFRLHEFEGLLSRDQMLNFFGLELKANSPFIVQMDHYDLFLDGGWGAAGAPLGLLNPLSRIG